MKTKIIYYLCMLLIAGLFFPITMKAQNYDERELQTIITFLGKLSGNGTDPNWSIAGFRSDPSGETTENVINHLKSEGIITLDGNNLVSIITLNRDYGGDFTVENFVSLSKIIISGTFIKSIRSVGNHVLTSVAISNCSVLEHVHLPMGHKKLRELTVSNCDLLSNIDLYGTDTFDPTESQRLNPQFSSLKITDCPLLKKLNCMGTSGFRNLNIDNPGSLTEVYAAGSAIFKNTSLELFTDLQVLDCSYSELYYLSIPNVRNLQVLKCDHNQLSSIELPSGEHFRYDEQDISINHNSFTNSVLKDLFGGFQASMVQEGKVYPQRIPEPSSFSRKVPFIASGFPLDLSKESFDGDGITSKYLWFIIDADQVNDFLEINIDENSYIDFITNGEQNGKITRQENQTPVYTPDDSQKGLYLLCMIEPTTIIRPFNNTDVNTYHIYQVIKAPTVELEVKIEADGEWKKVSSGGKTTIQEGKSAHIRAKLNRDGEGGEEDFYYRYWTLFFIRDGQEQRTYGMMLPWEIYYDFTEYVPIVEKGVHKIETTQIALNSDDRDAGIFPAPNTYTIEIRGNDDPGPGPDPEEGTPPELQYKVKVNEGAYYDVPTGGITEETEGNNVYLAIVPKENTSDIDYDGWKISYYDSDNNYIVSSQTEKGNLYEFNPETPHHIVGTYPYIVEELYLYRRGVLINGKPFPKDDKYTIRIIKKDDPGPLEPFPGIELQKSVRYCNDNEEIWIPFELLYTKEQIYYQVSFSEEAIQEGFKDVNEQQYLPDNGLIRIPLPENIPKGVYKGTVHLFCENQPQMIEKYNFEIQILEATKIIRQPVRVDNLCIGDPVIFDVGAEGESLSYQWYHQDKAIEGAKLPRYEFSYSEETAGEYYVLIDGLCGAVKSHVVSATGSGLYIEMKWDDLLHARNPENKYVTYQWYKDGEKIIKDGNSIYYTHPDGLSGNYTVRAFYPDGSFIESCPYAIEIKTKGYGVNIYPTSLVRYSHLTIEITDNVDVISETRIEIIDMNGKVLYSRYATESRTDISIGYPVGIYMVRVTSPTMRPELKKILVKE